MPHVLGSCAAQPVLQGGRLEPAELYALSSLTRLGSERSFKFLEEVTIFWRSTTSASVRQFVLQIATCGAEMHVAKVETALLRTTSLP